MHYEVIALTALFVCTIILCCEYAYLFILAEKQEQGIHEHNAIFEKLENMLSSILSSVTEASCKDEIEELKEYSHKNDKVREEACTLLLQLLADRDNMIESKQRNLDKAVEAIEPIEFYSKQLSLKDNYKKGYACRRLAEFKSIESIPDIREFISFKHRDLVYNAGIALSRLGDKDGVTEFIKKCQSDKRYSYRIIVELVSLYTGDVYELVSPLLKECDEYMQSVLIKAVTSYKIKKFAPVYLAGIKNTSSQMKIACTKALAALEEEQYVTELIILSADRNSVVRGAAIKGLAPFNKSKEALEAVVRGVTDNDWWVRQIAAAALIKMDDDLEHINRIIRGHDRFASEAVKSTLYKTYALEESEEG